MPLSRLSRRTENVPCFATSVNGPTRARAPVQALAPRRSQTAGPGARHRPPDTRHLTPSVLHPSPSFARRSRASTASGVFAIVSKPSISRYVLIAAAPVLQLLERLAAAQVGARHGPRVSPVHHVDPLVVRDRLPRIALRLQARGDAEHGFRLELPRGRPAGEHRVVIGHGLARGDRDARLWARGNVASIRSAASPARPRPARRARARPPNPPVRAGSPPRARARRPRTATRGSPSGAARTTGRHPARAPPARGPRPETPATRARTCPR